MTTTSTSLGGGYIRMRALIARVPVAKSTIWTWVKAGTFPAPIKLSANVTAWRNEDVAHWEAERGNKPVAG